MSDDYLEWYNDSLEYPLYDDILPFCDCLYCQDPINRDFIKEMETNLMFGDLEEKLEFTVPHNSLEDKVMRVHPELGCSCCPPNKSENEGHTGKYSNYRRYQPKSIKKTKEKNQQRRFKERQRDFEEE